MTTYSALPATFDSVAYSAHHYDLGRTAAWYMSNVSYPAMDAFNILGPILAPSLYAEGLSALELASSGKVAVTLNDAHAFDMTEADKIIHFRARNLNSFLLETEQGQASIFLDAAGSNIALASKNDLTAGASNAMALSVAFGPMALTSQSNLSATSVGGDVLVSAAHLTSLSTTTLAVAASGSATLGASNNVSVTSATGVLHLTAATGDMLLDTASSLKSTAAVDFSIVADQDILGVAGRYISWSASNDMLLYTGCNMTLSAPDGTLTLEATTLNMSGGGLISAPGALGMVSYSNSVTISSQSNVQLTASNDLVMFGVHSASLGTDGPLALAAGDSVFVSASNDLSLIAVDKVAMASLTSGVTIEAASNLGMGASNNASLAAGKQLALSAGDNMMLAADDDIHLDGDDIYITARSNVFIDGLTDSIVLRAADTLTAVSSNQVVVGGSNGVYISTPAFIDQTAVGAWTATSGDSATLAASNNVTINAGQQYKQVFQIGGVPIIEMYKTSAYDATDSNNLTDYKVKINADFEIAGITTNVNVFSTSLTVENKLINLAFNSNLGSPADGPLTNDGAGIQVDGIPALDFAGSPVTVNQPNAALYEKSIKWHSSTGGVPALAQNLADPTAEAFWEVKGGAFRMTQKVASDLVTFCFRINHLKELELWKSQVDFETGAAVTAAHFSGKRMAKFGRTF